MEFSKIFVTSNHGSDTGNIFHSTDGQRKTFSRNVQYGHDMQLLALLPLDIAVRKPRDSFDR